MNFGMPAGKRTACATPVGMIIRNYCYTKRRVQLPTAIIIGGNDLWQQTQGIRLPLHPPVTCNLGLHVHTTATSFYVDTGNKMRPELY